MAKNILAASIEVEIVAPAPFGLFVVLLAVRGEDGVRVRPISSTGRFARRGNRLAVAVGSTGRGCFLMCNYIAARTHFRIAMRLLDSGPGVGPTACEPPRHRRNAPSADSRPNLCPGRTWA